MTSIRTTGPRSFRPTLEGLETREMMDAGLGHALLPSVAYQNVAHVRMISAPNTTPQRVALNPSADVSTGLDQAVGLHGQQQAATPALTTAQQDAVFILQQGQRTLNQDLPPRGATPPQAQGGLSRDYLFGDTRTVIDRGQQFLNDTVIGSFNVWGLHRNAQLDSKQIDGDKIKLTFKVDFGIAGKKTCKIDLTFERKDAGGVRAYTLSAAALRNWDGVPFVEHVLRNEFEGAAKRLFNKEVRAIECDRFDEKTAGETASAIRRELLDRLHAFIGDKNEEAGTGGFRNVRIRHIDGGYQVEMSVTWPNFKEATVSFRFTGETVDPSTGRVRFEAKVTDYKPAPGQQNLSFFYQDALCKDFSVQLNRSA
jgi:hypothetical protein